MFVDGNMRKIPVLVRKVGVDVMWRNYDRDRFNYPSGIKKVQRTLLCHIESKLTRGNVKQRVCMDYKLYGIFYEKTNLLRRIIDDHIRRARNERS